MIENMMSQPKATPFRMRVTLEQGELVETAECQDNSLASCPEHFLFLKHSIVDGS